MTSLAQHIDVISPILGSLFVIVGYFFVRTLRQIDSNQKDLAENQSKMADRLVVVEHDFYILKGEHNVAHKMLEGKK